MHLAQFNAAECCLLNLNCPPSLPACLPARLPACPPSLPACLPACLPCVLVFVCLQAFRGITEVHALVDALCINASNPAIVLTQVRHVATAAAVVLGAECVCCCRRGAARAALPGRLCQTEQHMVFFSISVSSHPHPRLV